MKENIVTFAGVSDSSIEKTTGKSWNEWMDLLDKHDGDRLSHKEIVDVLSRHLEGAWWCQKIANTYEKYKGQKVLGQTANGKFQIGVTRTINVDKDTLWNLISSDKGIEIWLGKTMLDLSESTIYKTPEGIRGEVTVLKPGSHFRMTWQPKNWDHKSTLQVRTIPKKEKTVLSFHQEGLMSSEEREQMKAYWTDKINQIIELAVSRGLRAEGKV